MAEVYISFLSHSESLPHSTNTIWYCYLVLLYTCHDNEIGLITSSDIAAIKWRRQKAHPAQFWFQSPWPSFSAPSFQNDFIFHSTYLDFTHFLSPSSTTLFEFLQYTQFSFLWFLLYVSKTPCSLPLIAFKCVMTEFSMFARFLGDAVFLKIETCFLLFSKESSIVFHTIEILNNCGMSIFYCFCVHFTGPTIRWLNY